ncbi:MAG: SRPBCC domain-containing protein [Phycisphaerales bacterium]|nr:SRPBCC domain-containing protein [Phycisphaerales bacterium]
MGKSFAPDLSSRPNSMTLELRMKADAASIYNAWTRDFDLWFAETGELIMAPEVNRPFFFYNRHDWGRHAHYGRFITLEKNKLIEMTWLTGKDGTFGAETVIRIELVPQDKETVFRMTHSGFENEAAAKAHKDNWPLALEELDKKLASQ